MSLIVQSGHVYNVHYRAHIHSNVCHGDSHQAIFSLNYKVHVDRVMYVIKRLTRSRALHYITHTLTVLNVCMSISHLSLFSIL